MVSNTTVRKEELEHLIDGVVERFMDEHIDIGRYTIEKYDLVGELADVLYGYYGGK